MIILIQIDCHKTLPNSTTLQKTKHPLIKEKKRIGEDKYIEINTNEKKMCECVEVRCIDGYI